MVNAPQLIELSAVRNTFYSKKEYVCMYVFLLLIDFLDGANKGCIPLVFSQVVYVCVNAYPVVLYTRLGMSDLPSTHLALSWFPIVT